MIPSTDAVKTADLVVQGMTCASCVRRVERAVRQLPGVQDATVNFATSQARVTYDPASADRDAIAAAIEAAGYEVPRAPTASHVELSITGMTCAACVRRIEKALCAVPGVADATVKPRHPARLGALLIRARRRRAP